MTRRIFFSPAAVDDFEDARLWYTQPGAGRAARDKLRRINTVIENLSVMPLLWPAGLVPGTREAVVAGHTVIYRVENDTGVTEEAGDIDVIRIWRPGLRPYIGPENPTKLEQ